MKSLLFPPIFCLLAVPALADHTGGGAPDHGFADLPFAIACTDAGVRSYAYLARVEADGTAVYMTPTSIALTVAHDGPVEASGDSHILGDCAGHTLAELRDAGQALPGGD